MRLRGTIAADLADSFWRSLQYFSLYRLVVAAVFFSAYLLSGGAGNVGAEDGRLFMVVAALYLVASFGFLFVLRRVRRGFDLQLSLQVLVDIGALVLLMYASGGAKSGIAVMLVVVVAGAGLVGQGRLTLFYAALATLAVLGEQVFRLARLDADTESLFRTGLISTGFFATAIIARLLARRALANEALARQRGAELEGQVRINQQVIRDMDDGILVVDGGGRVRLHNPRAEALLRVQARDGAALGDYSAILALHLRDRDAAEETTVVLQTPGAGTAVLARVLPPEEGGNTLIYLQDLGRAEAQARQIKLAALGRLTANLAHEIRNPLGAISHAAELLADEQRAEGRSRLVRIIGDNSARLNRLVIEVLELGRRDRAEPEAIILDGFLRQFVDEYGLHDATARQRVSLSVADGTTVSFDRTHLHRVLENLVTNALRYAGSGPGAVLVKSLAGPTGRIEMHIIDDGPGIPESDRGKVFEPFFTTRGSGTGLGLYIARELCEANDARLELMDSPAGTHFRIVAKEGTCPIEPNAAAATT
jgi:two-component system sensor histidine kinase PilS (NtrC family)